MYLKLKAICVPVIHFQCIDNSDSDGSGKNSHDMLHLVSVPNLVCSREKGSIHCIWLAETHCSTVLLRCSL